MTLQTLSSLYSTHASRPRKRPTSTTLVRAIAKVMKTELSSTAIARWHDQLDEAIGEPFFNAAPNIGTRTNETGMLALPAPKMWCPVKPETARLLVEALVSTEPLPDGRPIAIAAPLAIGSPQGSKVAKIISRRLVELVIAKHYDTLRSSGEVREQLFVEGSEKQLCAAIARHATDVITYVSSRAKELAVEEQIGDVLLEMQTVDQYLHGRETRGSGLVVCEKGMALIEEVVRQMLGSAPAAEGGVNASDTVTDVERGIDSSDGE